MGCGVGYLRWLKYALRAPGAPRGRSTYASIAMPNGGHHPFRLSAGYFGTWWYGEPPSPLHTSDSENAMPNKVLWRTLARRVWGRWRRYVRLRLRRRVRALTRATAFKQLNLQCVEARITSFLVRCPIKLSWPRF